MKIEGLDDIDEDVFKHDNEGVSGENLNNTIYRMEDDPYSARSNQSAGANDPVRSSIIMPAPTSNDSQSKLKSTSESERMTTA